MKLSDVIYFYQVSEDEVIVSNCELQDMSVAPLLKALHLHKAVAALDLSHNLLGNDNLFLLYILLLRFLCSQPSKWFFFYLFTYSIDAFKFVFQSLALWSSVSLHKTSNSGQLSVQMYFARHWKTSILKTRGIYKGLVASSDFSKRP